MLSFYIIFGDRNPPYPALGSNIPSVRRPGQRFHFLLCRGSSTSPSLLKQAWRNPKEGRVGCLHQNIFTRKVTDIAFTSDFCNNYSYSASPASLYLTSPRPRPTRPHVAYLMSSSLSSRVTKSQVPTHASRCPRPSFILSRQLVNSTFVTLDQTQQSSSWEKTWFVKRTRLELVYRLT